VGGTDKLTDKESGIAEVSQSLGNWAVFATLSHELSHTNGAPGTGSKAARRRHSTWPGQALGANEFIEASPVNDVC
jgi:hypothetical protein